MNLLTEEWIPVEHNGQKQRITLETLLTTDTDWKIASFRDDMELATIQLLVSLVQVTFVVKDRAELIERLKTPLTADVYKKSIEPLVEWFDLAHDKWPFMQSAKVVAQKNDGNFSSLQKLFVGLPEKSSDSPKSNAFFNRIDEIESTHFGDVAVALFQQSTNGFSLGGSSFSVGLKGGMPLTTLIYDENIRKTIWYNVLTTEYLSKNQYDNKEDKPRDNKDDRPTWVSEAINQESATKIGLMRGLFWQPSKMKLRIEDNVILGFYTEPGLCIANGFWMHPHTPMNMIRYKNNNPKEKPHFSLSGNRAMWSQMLCFFYSPDSGKSEEGTSNAIVVTQYRQYFLGQPINLAVGGYINGGSAEKLGGRRHETYTLAQGWEDRAGDMIFLIKIGNSFEAALSSAIKKCCVIAFVMDQEKKDFNKQLAKLKDHIFGKYKEEFYRNSEPIFHTILKQTDWADDDRFIERLKDLTLDIYEKTTETLKTDVKYFRGVAEGRRLVHSKIKEIVDGNRLV